MESIEDKVVKRIYANHRGWAFSKNDFLDIDLVLDWRVAGGERDLMGERSKTKQQKLNQELNEKACVYIAETMLPLLNEALEPH